MTNRAPLSREMTATECRALLESQRVCVLSLIDEDEPYAVPLFYGLDGEALVLGLSEGRKTRALDRNPRVCVTITEVRSDGFWQSAQVRGVIRWLASEADREAAIGALMAHNRRLGHVAAGAARDDAGSRGSEGVVHRAVMPGRLARLEGEVTGRARTVP